MDNILAIQTAVETALSKDCEKIWKLRIGLARFLLSDGSIVPDWTDLTAMQQMATVWLHSHELTEILSEQGPPASKFLDLLLAKNGSSPRHVFEQAGSPMARDAADPRNLDLPRLLAVETGTLLCHLSKIEDAKAWAISRLTDTRFMRTPEGDVPNALIARNAFATNDVLFSRFSSDLSDELDAIKEGCGITSAGSAEALHLALLEEVDSSDHVQIDMSLRFIAGNAAMQPLPGAMEAKLKELLQDYRPIEMIDAKSDENGLRIGLQNLLSLTCLASVNGWNELQADIDNGFSKAIEAMKATEMAESSLLLDVAFWRARMEDKDAERLLKLASQFQQLAKIDSLVEPLIYLTRDFARKLSGAHSAPFVDAACRLTMEQ